MRKDVRIGLAIGGVLLAVLIVYLLVPKENANDATKAQQTAQNTGGDVGNGANAGATAGAQQALDSAAGAGVATGGSPSTGPATDTTSPAAQQSDPTVASSGANGSGATPANDGAAATGVDRPEGSAGNTDWDTLLNSGVSPQHQSLMATHGPGGDPFADPARQGASSSPASAAPGEPRQAVGTPQDNINWGVGTGGGSSGTGSASTGGGASSVTPAPTTPAGGAAPSSHKMQQGETFSSIALQYFGDAKYAREIVKANPNVEPSRVRAGTVIKLPDSATVKASQNPTGGTAGGHPALAATAKAEPAIDASKEYRVQSNDSLHKIALKLYGKSDKADAIYEVNKDKIGADPHRIKVGMVLKLPEAPTQAGATR